MTPSWSSREGVSIAGIEPSRQIAAVSQLFLRANGQDKYDVSLRYFGATPMAFTSFAQRSRSARA
jgi:hypothetical protein